MIWIDSSFAIEWLYETDRARKISLPRETLGILPAQYTETLVFFLKRGHELSEILNELESLELKNPDKIDLQHAARLYLEARSTPKSKVSLADAILAAVAGRNKEFIAAFDQDFAELGFKEKSGFWYA